VCVRVGEYYGKNNRGYIRFQRCFPKILPGTTDRLNYYMVIFSVVVCIGRYTYMATLQQCIYVYYFVCATELIFTAITSGVEEK